MLRKPDEPRDFDINRNKEIIYFFNTRNITRIEIFIKHSKYQYYKTIKSCKNNEKELMSC